jgi:hypothetical protein
MQMKPKGQDKTLRKQSRAALWTIQLAVDAVADSVRQLKILREHALRGHRSALQTLRMARHHCLEDHDLRRLEESIARFARLSDWPAAMRTRARYEHLERPLSGSESRLVTNLAGSALTVAAGMLDTCEQLDGWYSRLAITAAAAADAALPKVTCEVHRRKADKLMLRLEQLRANHQIAWVFVAGRVHRQASARTLN